MYHLEYNLCIVKIRVKWDDPLKKYILSCCFTNLQISQEYNLWQDWKELSFIRGKVSYTMRKKKKDVANGNNKIKRKNFARIFCFQFNVGK